MPVLMAAYGSVSMSVVVCDVASGAMTWGDVATRWGELSVLLGFTGWGVTLLVAAYGYLRITGPSRAPDADRVGFSRRILARRWRWTARTW
jgi:hypothetical protein